MINYSLEYQLIGTGSSYGAIPENEHASHAVQTAIAKIDPDKTIGGVLLFLTSAYAHAPQEAIKMAAKAAGTPQVFGCCALNLLTEDEWLLDVEGAVAMVFTTDLSPQPLRILEQTNENPSCVLTLTSPNASAIAINSTKHDQIGAISSDQFGHGPYSIWQSGRIEEHEYSLSGFPKHLTSHTIFADDVKQLSPSMLVNLAESHEIQQVNQELAFETLPEEFKELAENQPYQLLCAVSQTNDPQCLEQGYYKLHHVVSANRNTGVIQLSGKPKAGRYLFWAIRDPAQAEQTIRKQLDKLKDSINQASGAQAVFALMFPNIGRGPEFFNGIDIDLKCFNEAFPDLPMIGFYGNGEIGPGVSNTSLIKRYSTILTVFTHTR